MCRLVRVNWRTVGAVVERVVADELDPARLDGLYHIGVDKVSYRKHHHYLTLVTDHDTTTVVWAAEGKDADTLRGFFDELGGDRAAALQAVSLDMGRAYPKAVAEGAPQAEICWDPFHIVAVRHEAPCSRVGCNDPPSDRRALSVRAGELAVERARYDAERAERALVSMERPAPDTAGFVGRPR